MAKRKPTEDSALNFEESLQELQGIVQQLENGTQGLEISLQQFERGIHLLRHCYQQLDSAEQKIELLVGFNAEGQPVTTPFDATSTADLKASTAGRRAAAEAPKSDLIADAATASAGIATKPATSEIPLPETTEIEDEPTLF